ncbi:right-handed parallel beta-helix repeat-containing protein [Halobaculum marinum]|uniref:Right-handed parallel beta-helix repeat-containing protein n=1 Tax=Halobaculum marinum TaxID=3031996 RepID=A0ABD5WUW0_9EURY|nr:right-handed parallel beta-helix repeat-containing protein [Halobaculum sp. DT55]
MSQSSRLRRTAAVALVVAVTVVVGVAPVAVGTTPTVSIGTDGGQLQTATTIDSCTTITQPGVYRLADDITADISGACLHVRSSDVVLDGNGHTVTGDGVGTAVLAYEGTPDGVADGPLSNVTVRNISVTDWQDGVEIGTNIDEGVEGVRVLGVTASDNRFGISFTESRDIEVRAVTATGNRVGFYFWETYDGSVDGLTATDNDEVGLYLAQNVGRITFTDAELTGNGADRSDRGALRMSDDVGENVIRDSYIADNAGHGITLSDTYNGNTIRDTIIENNGGSGIYGDYASGERLIDVTIRDNGGHAIDVEDGSIELTRVSVDDVRVTMQGGAAEVDADEDDPFWLDTVQSDTLPTATAGAPVADEALVANRLPASLRVVYDLDSAGYTDSEVDLWRYNGAGWAFEADGSVTGDRFVATVDRDGTFVPLGPTDGGDGGDAGDLEDATLEVLSTEENQFEYEIVVEGTAEKSMTEDVAADSGDRVVDNGDGTVTISGSTGSNSGDAFTVSGRIVSVEISGVDDGYQLVLDGEDVTDEYAPVNGDDDSDDGESEAILEVLSTEENQFEYEIVVEGTAEKTMTEDVAADSSDRVVDNGDGTVTITGSTGSNSGDAFAITGTVVSVEIDGVDDGYEVLVDGDSVSSGIVTDDGADADDDDGGDDTAGAEVVLEVLSTEENQFEYEIVVDGTAEKTMTEDVAADSGDRVVDNGDGTVTISGSTGSNSGDAFTITGTVVSVEISGTDDGYEVLVDGDSVSSGIVTDDGDDADDGDDGDADDSDDDTADSEVILEVLSTEENQFEYEIVVEGTAEKTMTDDVAADSGDQVVDNGDGTVTISGSTGSNSGDAFVITGTVVSVEIDGADDGYRIVVDGDDVTDEYD